MDLVLFEVDLVLFQTCSNQNMAATSSPGKRLLRSKAGLKIVPMSEGDRSPFELKEPEWIPDKLVRGRGRGIKGEGGKTGGAFRGISGIGCERNGRGTRGLFYVVLGVYGALGWVWGS